jgi:hypothetical protein
MRNSVVEKVVDIEQWALVSDRDYRGLFASLNFDVVFSSYISFSAQNGKINRRFLEQWAGSGSIFVYLTYTQPMCAQKYVKRSERKKMLEI